MLKVDYEHCTGCGACVQHCPKQCISWKAGEFGFRYPIIDEKTCIDCHLCEKVCPIDKELKKPEDQKVYAVVNSDKETLLHSTSGGAFSAIAESILSDGGVVYGCSMEDGFQVRHIRVSTSENLQKLRGSKYVQSNTGTTFKHAEEDLRAGLKVLYSGTPCQIAGLQNYLGKEYDNLLTVDIVCHGVGSQAYFDKFMDDLRRRYGDVQDVRFRDKKYVGWSCGGVVVSLSPNKEKTEQPFYNHENYYYSYFLSGDIYRKSCYACKYANAMRQGDITLGDFWGVEALKLPIDSYNGCSLMIVNTEKGKMFVNDIEGVKKVEATVEDAVRHNDQLSHPSKLPEIRQQRLEEYNKLDGLQIQKNYLETHKKGIIRGKIKVMIPKKLRAKLRGI